MQTTLTLQEVSKTLPQNSSIAIRVDGKSFTKFTKSMRKKTPFSEDFNERMLFAAEHLLKNVDGAALSYVGSDEISVIIPKGNETTQKWFGGRVDKIASVSASLASVAFNHNHNSLAVFDAKVFDLGVEEAMVLDYLNSRRDSLMKNSVSMLASHHFSHKELQGVSTEARKSMLEEKEVLWNELSPHNKYGTVLSELHLG